MRPYSSPTLSLVRPSPQAPTRLGPVAALRLVRPGTRTHTTTPTRSQTTTTTAPHNTLASFLTHAHRTSLSPKSTTYIGTHYEYVVQRALRRLGLTLQRTGGRGDGGVDLCGVWCVPCYEPGRIIEGVGGRVDGLGSVEGLGSRDAGGPRGGIHEGDGGVTVGRKYIKTLIQCKALSATRKVKAGPALIRELEGASSLLTHPYSPSTSPTTSTPTPAIRLLITPSPATPGVRSALARSRLPMGFLKVSSKGCMEQCLWNRAAGVAGLEGVGVDVRFVEGGGGRGEEERAPGGDTRLSEVEGEGMGECGSVEAGLRGGDGSVLRKEVVLLHRGRVWDFPDQDCNHGRPHEEPASGVTSLSGGFAAVRTGTSTDTSTDYNAPVSREAVNG